MKTVRKGSEVRRVSEEEADALVKERWKYVPKSEWKKHKAALKEEKKS